jgi:hypothetical protein
MGPGDRKRGRLSKSAKGAARVQSAPPAAAEAAPEPATTIEDRPALAAYRERFGPDRPPRWTTNQRPPIDYFLRLFDDPEFWRDTLACFGALGDVVEQGLPGAASQQASKEILEPFWYHYRAMPALQFLPVYYRQGFSVVTGHWGVVPVYPWTKDTEINVAVRRIRRAIKQTRGDVERDKRAALGWWLKFHGFTARAIATALGTPNAGERSRDPTTRRPAEGSEPPIDAWVRISRQRMKESHAQLHEAMRSPTRIDPLTDAITAVLRVGVFRPATFEDLAAAVARLHDLLVIRPVL